MLKVGRIQYANCTPLFHELAAQHGADYTLVTGVPAHLNRLLAAGEIDVCPSSSIEYANYQGRYKIVPQLSIASVGAVASVLLFTRIPIELLDGTLVLLSSESATSVNLLKILLQQRYNCSCSFQAAGAHESNNETAHGLLLIGDAALRQAQEQHYQFVYDLGELWFAWTGYPFVYALWLCRREVAESQELHELAVRLIRAKERVPDRLEQIVATAEEATWMGREKLLCYWRDNISYQLDERFVTGLMLYYTKCCELGLITVVPELDFVEIN